MSDESKSQEQAPRNPAIDNDTLPHAPAHELQATVGGDDGEQSESRQFKENIDYVTPYAFRVSESVYGLPLAKPRKRLFALAIDWVLIGMLTKVSYVVLFGFYAALLLSVASRLKAKQKHNFAGKATKAAGFFCLFVFSLGAIEYISQWWFYSEKASSERSQSAETSDSAKATESQAAETVNPPELKDLDDYDWQWQKNLEEQYGGKDENEDREGEKPPQLADGLMPWLESNLTEFGISFGWAAFYFTVFVGLFSGQTPGKRLAQIKIIKQDGTDLTLWEAFGRYGGYGAGFATGLLGFLQVYWDPNRQAIQDKISGTLVIDTNKEQVQL